MNPSRRATASRGRRPEIGIEAVPLVEGDDEGSSSVEQIAEQTSVLLGHPFPRVEHQDRDVCRLDGLQRFDGAHLLDRAGDPRSAPQPGGVDENEGPAPTLERHEYAVAGRSGCVVGDHPVLAQQAVDEGGLARVRAADNRDVQRPSAQPCIVGRRRISAGASGTRARARL